MEPTMRFKFVFTTLILLTFLSIAQAIPWKDRFGVGGSATMYKMWGGERDRSSLAIMGGIEARYGLTPYIQIGADLNYGTFKPSTAGTSTIQDESSAFQTTVMPINVFAKFSHLIRNDVKPYIIAGGGLLVWNLEEQGESLYGTELNAGLNYGIGFE